MGGSYRMYGNMALLNFQGVQNFVKIALYFTVFEIFNIFYFSKCWTWIYQAVCMT